MRRAIPIVVLVAALAAAAAWYFLGRGSGEAGALTGSGTIEAKQVSVSSQASGKVMRAPLEEGVRVKAGQPLFEIDDSLARLAVDQAAEGVRAAQAAVTQAEDDGTDAEVDAAKARLEQARIAQKVAEVQLGYTRIASPVAGVLVNVLAQAGENAAPGQTVALVSNTDSLTVSVFIPETEIGRVKVGDTAKLTTDSSDETFDCKVTFIASEAEFTPANVETKDQRAKLVYEVRLDVTNSGAVLKPGMPADVAFED